MKHGIIDSYLKTGVILTLNNQSIKQYIENFNKSFLFESTHDENVGGAGIGSWINYVILVGAIKDQLAVKDREAIEQFLGSSIEENETYLISLLSQEPKIFSFAVTFWNENNHNFLRAIDFYCKQLLIEVRNSIPSQKEADKWVSKATMGIITTFPVDLENNPDINAILVNAIATKFNWIEPYKELRSDFTENMDFWGEKSYLFSVGEELGINRVFLYKGHVFGEHTHESARNDFKEKIFVKSIIGEDNVTLDLVYEAGTASDSEKFFLKTLEDFDNNKVNFVSYKESQARHNLVKAILPAWEVDSKLELDDFGLKNVYSLYSEIFKENIDFSAVQVFKSAYNKKGFEAAAVTAIRAGASSFTPPSKTVEALISFDKPFVAITEYRIYQKENNSWQGIPLFTSVIRKSVPVSDKSFK